MSEQWFQDYVLLQFRMDKAIRKFTGSRFVDYYYGPPEWRATVEDEAETPAIDLIRAAMALTDALPVQSFEGHRAKYLDTRDTIRAGAGVVRRGTSWCGKSG